MLILLSGMIGAGKTSLSTILANHYDLKIYEEPVKKNKLLPMFYKNPHKYAYSLQYFFSQQRFKNMKKALILNNGVMDRSIYEDKMFFNTMADVFRCSQLEKREYKESLDKLISRLPNSSPDLMVFLDAPYDTIIKRIKQRSRPYEQPNLHPYLSNYYKELLDSYKEWYNSFNVCKKIKINTKIHDFVNDPTEKKAVLKIIDTEIRMN